MSGYNYISEAEWEWTQKYEGTYTPEEIALNKKLGHACDRETPDFALVEELLKQGADPLGGKEIGGWDLLEHIYGDVVVCGAQDFGTANLPRLTELFLKYGMDIEKPRIPYDGENSLNPLWHFAHVANENTIHALKMLLDHGLSAASFAEFWDHSTTDFFYIECGDPQNDPIWNYECTWTFKMLLLGASYDHILEDDGGLREFVCCDMNSYDVHNFRNWNDYEYYFDTTYCKGSPTLYGSILRIYEKATGNEIWKSGVGKAGRESLEKL